MALFNPLQFFVFPFMIFVALPLAICAGITTVFAFAILFLRLFWVYFDVGMETIRYVVLGHAQPPPYSSLQSPTASRLASTTASPQITRPPSPESTSPLRTTQRRRRRSSRAAMTPLIGGLDGGSGSSLGPSAGLGRDFEGVGGWRSDQNTEDERVWESLNSRLEMPDPLRYHFPLAQRQRGHHTRPAGRRNARSSESPHGVDESARLDEEIHEHEQSQQLTEPDAHEEDGRVHQPRSGRLFPPLYRLFS
ncbi:uncharacterized protein PG998_004165 [Apiospora kogelbergensis]|uniref:uncharacterized protein n=1 Tax=Apiospora kogelbergensis TaxID=1337665 RepID=UPI00312CC2BC